MRRILEQAVASINHYIDILRTQRLTTAIYNPRGTRPLYDALGKAIIDFGHQLAALPREERPNRVIVILITDG